MKVLCEDCEWCGDIKEMLSAVNPFNEDALVQGCPNCKEVIIPYSACSIDGCSERACNDKPTNDGYMMFCYRHG